MKKPILILLFLLLTGFAKAQQSNADTTAENALNAADPALIKPAVNDSSKFYRIDVLPAFPGGIDKLYKYIQKNKRYDSESGKVMIQFIVEKDGILTNIKVIKSLNADADAEAIRLMSNCPKWKPGMQNGRPVQVQYTMPIIFGDN
jgi:protein TonB